MASGLSKKDRENLETYIKEHPVPDGYDTGVFDDHRTKESEEIASTLLARWVLEQASKE